MSRNGEEATQRDASYRLNPVVSSRCGSMLSRKAAIALSMESGDGVTCGARTNERLPRRAGDIGSVVGRKDGRWNGRRRRRQPARVLFGHELLWRLLLGARFPGELASTVFFRSCSLCGAKARPSGRRGTFGFFVVVVNNALSECTRPRRLETRETNALLVSVVMETIQ